MRISEIILVLFVALLAPSHHAWAAYPFTPAETASKMNATSKKLGFDLRFSSDSCPAGAVTCTIDGGPVTVAVEAEDLGPNVDNMTMIYTPDGSNLTALNALVAWGIMIATVAPELTPKERGKVIKLLADEIGPSTNVTRSFGRTRYTLQSSPLIGVWLRVESPN